MGVYNKNTPRGYKPKERADMPNNKDEKTEKIEKKCPHCSCAKTTVRDEARKKQLLNRLKRMEGQLRGIQTMIENDAYCNDILIQSAAVSAAIGSFNKELLSDHIHHCVARDLREGKDEVIDELTETLKKLMR